MGNSAAPRPLVVILGLPASSCRFGIARPLLAVSAIVLVEGFIVKLLGQMTALRRI